MVHRGSFSQHVCADNHEAGSTRLILLKELSIRFYKQPHAFYAGIDLHARSMCTHILDHAGQTVFERDLPANPDAFRNAIAPYRNGLVVGVECMFAWYWRADLCEDEAIPFTLGHALYMKAIHGAARQGSSSPSCVVCTWHGEVSGTRRLQIPSEGKTRQSRRRVGTHVGPIPYRCLAPPRFFPLVRKNPAKWTPLLEPSRRRRSTTRKRVK